jgi:hypothetical protein
MQQQGWVIKDQYRNTTRPAMPDDETITSFADRIIELAGRVITENAGQLTTGNGRTIYRIRVQKPANVESLSDLTSQLPILRSKLKQQIESGLTDGASVQQQARSAYLAICLGVADTYRQNHPQRWSEALACLEQYPQLLRTLFYDSPGPAGDRLRDVFLAAGLKKPDQVKR